MNISVSQKLKLTIAALAALAIGSSQALANPIVFNSNGQFNLGNFSVAINGGTPSCIDFYLSSPPACSVTSPGSVNATLNSPSDLIFGTVGTTTGVLKDNPGMSNTNSQNFKITGLNSTLTTATTYDFDLLSLNTPTTPICGGAGGSNGQAPYSCVVAGSPFVFTQDTSTAAGQSTNSMDISLTETLCGYIDGTSPGTETSSGCTNGTVYTATFSSHFVGTIDSTGLPAQIGSALGIIAAGGTITDSISGDYTPNPVTSSPEPISFILFGSGLIGVALVGRKFRRS